ncbi:MarR family transcriptional regulator [Staphylococcus sp. ACRSN]|uniref:MarR family winged helix-turn-helix transcriptional regulator n=1 Tax=Staphylococcus sp. ACRSN TaxID=2918214 RepID=UPI001EF2C7A3|nr:MarR family transcriptional regulator [Staphylococcus sp. ACRSN]MCG7339501.1 MarR family transcriptional regulator [Staphylococcus sp. ACRSN]
MTKENVFSNTIDTLYETSRLLNEYESKPRKYGTEDDLYMVEAHIINLIGDKKHINISDIAKYMNRTKSAASQNISRLVKKGLVEKRKSTNSSREVVIMLSSKGYTVYQYHKNLDKTEYEAYLAKLEHFSTDDFEKIEQFLSIVNDNLMYLLKNNNDK